MIGEDKLIHFSGVALGEACTIVLRGASTHILEEADRCGGGTEGWGWGLAQAAGAPGGGLEWGLAAGAGASWRTIRVAAAVDQAPALPVYPPPARQVAP